MKIKLSKNLDAQREAAEALIDKQAGEVRLIYVTMAPGQDMVYQQKRDEARLVLSGEPWTAEDAPHIVREASDDGMTPEGKAAEIIAQSNLWKKVSAGIESKRLSAKKAVREAISERGIQEATEINWSEFLT